SEVQKSSYSPAAWISTVATATLATSPATTQRASGSRRYADRSRRRSAMKCVAKFTAAITMNRMNSVSISGDWKYATLTSWVENPPSDSTENAWQMASKAVMPAAQKATMHTAVMPAYTIHSDLAVSV